PLRTHDGLTTGHRRKADVPARRVPGVDTATGKTLHRGKLRQLQHVRDGIPHPDNAVVINGLDDELDRFLRGLLNTVPRLADQLDTLFEPIRDGLENGLVQGVEHRFDELVPRELDRLADLIERGLDDRVVEPQETRRERLGDERPQALQSRLDEAVPHELDDLADLVESRLDDRVVEPQETRTQRVDDEILNPRERGFDHIVPRPRDHFPDLRENRGNHVVVEPQEMRADQIGRA